MGKKAETGRRKTAVVIRLRFLQEMRDDRRRDGVDHLRTRIVAQEQAGELVIFHDRDGVAVVAILDRHADAIGEELAHVGRVTRHLHGGDEAFRDDERAGRFQLQRGEAIAHHGVGCELQRRQAVEEFLIVRLDQREVRFVIDHDHVGAGFLAGFGAFQFDVILIGNEIRGDEDAIFRQDGAERAFRKRRALLPRAGCNRRAGRSRSRARAKVLSA